MGVTHWRWNKIGMWFVLGLLALALAPAAWTQSQQGTGQILGTVFDPTGAAVPKAKVTATGTATGLLRETETNDAGQYRLVLLPPGPYTVQVSLTGFKGFKAEVTVTVGSALTVDARLQVGAVTEIVEVTASAFIETTAAQTDALINQRSIMDLPINGRRFQDFVTLTPTVQIEPQRNGISFAGQRGINANITIDGADYNQPFFGGIRGGERSNQAFSIPQEAIAEFQIVPYGYSAEFGRSTGGVMNAVTKSGTNDLHGTGFYFLRHKELAKKDALGRQALDSQHQAGGSLGGRIRRDKSFFFGSGEIQQINNPRQVVFRRLEPSSLPQGRTTANAEAYDYYKSLETPFTQTNDAWTILGRWDEQLTSNHRVSVRYHYSTNTALNAVATGIQIFPETSNALDNNGTEGDSQHTVAGQWTGIFSARTVNEFRAQYSKENRPRLSNSRLAGVGNTVGNIGARSFLPTTQKDYRFQLSDNLTWNVGGHSLKFGGEFNHLFADQFFQFNQFGIFSISGTTVNTVLNIMAVGSGGAGDPVNRFDDASNVSYLVNIGNGLAEMTMRELAFYVQDSWRITPRFTLNLGFRWEGYFNPSPDTSNTALTNTVRNFSSPMGITVDPAFIPDNLKQFMPRVGFAWDPTGQGKTVIRANAGIYFARSPLLLFAGPINNFRTPAGDLSAQLPLSFTGTCPAGAAGSALNTIVLGLPVAQQTTYCRSVWGQFLLANGVAGTPIDLSSFTLNSLPTLTQANIQNIATALALPFDPNQGVQPLTWADNYKSPRSFQWNLAMEREIGRGWSIGADYVYINTIHLERNREFNMPAPIFFGGGSATRTTANGTVTVNWLPDISLHPCFGLRAGSLCAPTSSVTVSVPQPVGSAVNITVTSPFATAARPVTTLGQVQQRESSARALYRALTFRTTWRRKKFQLQAYYTLGFNYSDDDNERSAGGTNYENGFNLRPDYNYSDLDTRHLLVFNGVWELPWGFTVSGLGRFRSARPLDATAGTFSYSIPVQVTPLAPLAPFSTTASVTVNSDVNGDRLGTDRPYEAPGVPFKRNAFRDRSIYNLDMRVAKRFNLPREGTSISIAADFFNLFNFDNMIYGSANRIYGAGINPVTGAVLNPAATFRQLRTPSACLGVNPTSGNKNCYDTVNTPGAPFQMQFGLRFQF